MTSTVQLDFHFSSAHFYENKDWSKKKNSEVFGKCYDTFGHGHDYNLVMTIQLNKGTAIQLVREEVQVKLQALDHHHLNRSIDWFENRVPTTENLTLFLIDKLKASHLYELLSVELKEDPSIGAKQLLS
jgi:6-pyruvoyltetrahydropterin/6-carboxytetrahydropterin synthase